MAVQGRGAAAEHTPYMTPSKSTPHIPPITRVLNLVTQHEEVYRQQDLQLAELARRLSSLEDKVSQSQEVVTAVRERNVFGDLDKVKNSLEQASAQLGLLTKSTQDCLKQHDSKALQMGLLCAEVEKLKMELLDMSKIQQRAVEGLEQLLERQLDRTKQALLQQVDEQIKAQSAAVQSQLAELRADSNASSSSSEATALQVNSLAGRLRSFAQAAEKAQQASVSQADAFRVHSETLGSTISALQVDSHKIKKHVVRLQKQVEGLQTLGHVAIAAEQTARQARDECQQASAAMVAASRDSAAAMSAAKSVKRRLQGSKGPQDGQDELRQEITLLAESMSKCLKQLGEASRRHPPPQVQPSYLQSLLAGAPLHTGQQYQSSVSGAGPTSDTWEAAHNDFDRFLHGHRLRSLQAAASASKAAADPAG